METRSVNGDSLTCYRYSPSALSIALYPNTALLMISHFESTHRHTCCTSHSTSYSSECISYPLVPYGTRARRLVSLLIPDLACPITSLLVSLNSTSSCCLCQNEQLYKGMKLGTHTAQPWALLPGDSCLGACCTRVGFARLLNGGEDCTWDELA
jgi:hypothetical protein